MKESSKGNAHHDNSGFVALAFERERLSTGGGRARGLGKVTAISLGLTIRLGRLNQSKK